MRLGSQTGNSVRCSLCADWQEQGQDPRDAELLLRKHLERKHLRVMVDRDEQARKGVLRCTYSGPRWNEDRDLIQRAF